MPSLEERMLAALKVYCLWSWLSAHPDKWKSDYPLFQELIINRPNSSLCPWCDIHRGKCSNCPLGVVGELCGDGRSWFHIWINAGRRYQTFALEKQRTALLDERGWAAGEIARIAWNEYKWLEWLSS